MSFDAASPRAVRDPAATASADAWLADEVAVDFRSVRPLVDRLRAALLGDDDPVEGSLPADVRLTAGQARRGGRIPVDVPLREMCRRWGGRGGGWGGPCSGCAGRGGAGRGRRGDGVLPRDVRDGARLVLLVDSPPGPATRLRLRVRVG